MASPDTALVKYDWEREQQVSRTIPDSRWFDETWRQDFKGLSQLTIHLTHLLLAAFVFLGFVYAYNWLHHTAQSGQEWVAITNVKIHSEPDISKKTRIGICEQGTRLRVISTQTVNKRIWYEIEIIGKQPENPKPANRMWVAAEYVTLLSQ